jgi:hypothetical protein
VPEGIDTVVVHDSDRAIVPHVWQMLEKVDVRREVMVEVLWHQPTLLAMLAVSEQEQVPHAPRLEQSFLNPDARTEYPRVEQ